MLAPHLTDIAARLAGILDSASADLPVLAVMVRDPDDGELHFGFRPVPGSLADAVEEWPAGGDCVAIAVSYPAGASPFLDHAGRDAGQTRTTVALSHDDATVLHRHPDGCTTSSPLKGRLLRSMRELWAIRLRAEAIPTPGIFEV